VTPSRSGPIEADAASIAGDGSPDLPQRVGQLGREIRCLALTTVSHAGMGHPGGDLSAADILATLFLAVLRIDPADPTNPARDRFILSKGHAAASYYATLALKGFLPLTELETFLAPNSRLSGHPSRRCLPLIEASTGPLGHGLAIATGASLAARLTGSSWCTYVLTGDGELDEGSNWEAIMLAAHYRLSSLTLVVDRNGLQQGDTTERTVRLEPLAAKFEAFGWAVCTVDGHDPRALIGAFSAGPDAQGRPRCIIAQTHKGKGVSFMEDRVDSHNKVPDPESLERAIHELRTHGHAREL
jgi:transketolase